jgi:hypothetical protein
MAVYLKQHQREKIGVDDTEAKQKQASLQHQKQQKLDESQKQLFAATDQKDKNNSATSGDITKETPNNPVNEKGDTKLNTIKMAAAMEAGAVITEIAPSSALSGAIPSTSITAAHGVPVAAGLAAPLFGFF